MDRSAGYPRIVIDLLRAQSEGAAGIALRRQERLTALLEHARARSALYRELYQGIPADVSLTDLPAVTKPQLMAAFDDWVTDPAVTLAGVREFIADPKRTGAPFLGGYFVCATSGTTGEPGLFVHDPFECRVMRAFSYRVNRAWLTGSQLVQLLRRRARWAAVFGTGGHFAGEGWMEWQRRLSRLRRQSFLVISLKQSMSAIAEQLNAFDPAVLTSYPSALEVLAEQQRAGRLRIQPLYIELGGESYDEETPLRLASAFACDVHDAYAASEFMPIAYSCSQRWLHVNSDWVVLEPVREDLSPTPAGEASHTVLLTNLANHVQPLIRYDLGDSVLARPDPCPCGDPLPAIRVSGRRDDTLRLEATDGNLVPISAPAVATVMYATPGLRHSQVEQSGPRTIRLRLDANSAADPDKVWAQARRRLREYLEAQGLTDIDLQRDHHPITRHGRSGKFRQVIGWNAGRGT